MFSSVLPRVTAGIVISLVPGCSGIPIDSEGTRHYLIIGFGLVSIPRPSPETSISVNKMHALGFSLSDQPGPKLTIGYASSFATSIPADFDYVVMEVTDRPFGPIRISANPRAWGIK